MKRDEEHLKNDNFGDKIKARLNIKIKCQLH